MTDKSEIAREFFTELQKKGADITGIDDFMSSSRSIKKVNQETQNQINQIANELEIKEIDILPDQIFSIEEHPEIIFMTIDFLIDFFAKEIEKELQINSEIIKNTLKKSSVLFFPRIIDQNYQIDFKKFNQIFKEAGINIHKLKKFLETDIYKNNILEKERERELGKRDVFNNLRANIRNYLIFATIMNGKT